MTRANAAASHSRPRVPSVALDVQAGPALSDPCCPVFPFVRDARRGRPGARAIRTTFEGDDRPQGVPGEQVPARHGRSGPSNPPAATPTDPSPTLDGELRPTPVTDTAPLSCCASVALGGSMGRNSARTAPTTSNSSPSVPRTW